MSDVDEFWGWVLTRWNRPGVDGQLLALQDEHGLVVLEILFLIWLAERGVCLSESQWQGLVAAASPWIENVVEPLRAQRNRWKQDHEMAELKTRLGRLELAGERELAGIYLEQGLVDTASQPGNDDDERRAWALTYNLALGFSRANPPVDVVVSSRIAELLGPEAVPPVSTD